MPLNTPRQVVGGGDAQSLIDSTRLAVNQSFWLMWQHQTQMTNIRRPWEGWAWNGCWCYGKGIGKGHWTGVGYRREF